MTERDPRIDPMVGDEIIDGNDIYKVVSVDDDYVTYTCEKNGDVSGPRKTPLNWWREILGKTETIIKRGDEQ